MYIKIARWCFQRRVFVVVAWAIAFVAIQVLGVAVGTGFDDGFATIDSESDRGSAILREEFGGQGASLIVGSIVVKAEQGVDDPEVRAAMEELITMARGYDGVTATDPFDPAGGGTQISPSGQVAFAGLEGDEDIIPLEETVEVGTALLVRGQELEAEIPGLQVEIGGASFAEFAVPESEVIGVAFAIVILIVAFGSVLAMGLPMAVALAGVGLGIAVSGLLSNVVVMPSFAPIIGTMIGLGVGIDYALFVVTRYRDELHEGRSPEASTAASSDTAGRAVVFAGLTVVVSLLGLLLIGLPFVAGIGIAAAVTVAITIIATLTLLPALLGFAQRKVEVTRWRGLIAAGLVSVALLGVGFSVNPLLLALPLSALVLIAGFFVPVLKREVPKPARKPIEASIWYRWSHLIQRRPWPFLLGATAALLIIAIPLLSLRLAFTDEGNYAAETTTRQAYDLLTEGFGPGYNGPFFAVTSLDGPEDLAAFQTVLDAIATDPAVAGALPAIPNPDGTAALSQIFSNFSPQAEETQELVERLRADVIPAAEAGQVDVSLTGSVPASIDFSSYLSGRSLVFFGVVLVLSFVLLMAVFRSLLVPLKAVVMNMLSIAAAYGVVVALFQWGHLSSITGIEPGPIEPFIPMMMFAIVFGLSMDYEVFLLSRIKESYERSGDAKNSVADGLASTARVITAAAAIMVVVFGSFLLEDDRISKVFGTGLSVAVFLDATLVRMLLVPATMELLGERNWWIPKWLDRIIPRLDVEGSPNHDADIASIPSAHETPVPVGAAAQP
ncbi:MAG TPA: MMPL family transporter [Ilumatobacter sp.]|nr:MMPL family transporter [Ilumatobacter sp.]